MSIVKDDLYTTVFRISQGDLGLFKQVTDSFLDSVGSVDSSTRKQGVEIDQETAQAPDEHLVQDQRYSVRSNLP